MVVLSTGQLTIVDVNDGLTKYPHFAYANIRHLCNEGQEFVLTTKSMIRYGKDSQWHYKEFPAGRYTANNLLMGRGDPANGIVKVAELVSDYSTTSSLDRSHIGIYVDENAAASNDMSKYHWSLFKGSDGANGIPGRAGTDGRTPFVHFAYSNSADGRTEFSVTNNGNKRYLGTYTDYTQADSTDPTRYKWVDMVGTVKVGGRNLFLNSLFKRPLKSRYSNYFLDDSTAQTQGQLEVSIDASTKFRNQNTLKIVSTFNGKYSNQKISFRLSGDDFQGTEYDLSNKELRISFWAKADVDKANFSARVGYRNTVMSKPVGREWNFYEVILCENKPNKASNDLVFHLFTKCTVWIAFPKVEEGTLITPFTEAPEDIREDISSKADNRLTQDQLDKLSERNSLLKAELEAKAAIDVVDKWIQEVKNLSALESRSRAYAEESLTRASERIIDLQKKVGDLRTVTDFVDTYMSQSEEGLIIGRKDGSSNVMISTDRISFISSGKEVASISQGVLQIDNGVFVKSLRIGRYITIQDPTNPDRNLTMYVGG
jgi:hypothetical protein